MHCHNSAESHIVHSKSYSWGWCLLFNLNKPEHGSRRLSLGIHHCVRYIEWVHWTLSFKKDPDVSCLGTHPSRLGRNLKGMLSNNYWWARKMNLGTNSTSIKRNAIVKKNTHTTNRMLGFILTNWRKDLIILFRVLLQNCSLEYKLSLKYLGPNEPNQLREKP